MSTTRRGTLITASEAEGVSEAAEWSRWISGGRAPEAGDGNGFRTNWADDLELLASHGVTEVAITLEWARLWPTQDRMDDQELEFRRNVLRRIRELGMQPWAVLVDGSLPGWFAEDEGGFIDDRSRGLLWPRHVDWVGEHFGDLVGGWIPQREPVQWGLWGHLLGATPPGTQRRQDGYKAVTSALDADLQAWRLLQGSAPVAVMHTARTLHAEPDNVKARPHAEWLDEALTEHWSTWLSNGAAREAFDQVIVQLRSAVRLDEEGAWSPHLSSTETDSKIDAFHRLVEHAGDRPVIAAADLAGVPEDGTARADYLVALKAGAVEAGATGWWQTSPIDGWHWQHGRSATPGLFTADREIRSEPNHAWDGPNTAPTD